MSRPLTRPLLVAAAAVAALLAAVPTAGLAQMPAPPVAAPANPPLPATDSRPLQYGRFTVEVVGHGPDVILIPGLDSSRDTFSRLVQAHSGQYRFHRIQIAGFAGTPAGDNASGEVVAPTVEAIARYISDQHLKRPAVIGHSLGGEAALMLAARHPDAVGRIMAVDSLPFLGALFGGPQATPEKLKPMADGMARGMAMSDDAGWAKGVWANTYPLVSAPADQAMVYGWGLASSHAVGGRAFADLIVTDLRPELAKIQVSATVLFAHGPQFPQDEAKTTAYITGLYANLKGAKLIAVSPSRHFIMFDQPERFDREVMTFLAN
ncbi:MAG: alpha/beta hydrolase [Proteobacteria bacterium]|nr:alpha/beta hydrolase [Pseudomonadota bacterium]